MDENVCLERLIKLSNKGWLQAKTAFVSRQQEKEKQKVRSISQFSAEYLTLMFSISHVFSTLCGAFSL